MRTGRECHIQGRTFKLRTVFGSVEDGIGLSMHSDAELVVPVGVTAKGI